MVEEPRVKKLLRRRENYAKFKSEIGVAERVDDLEKRRHVYPSMSKDGKADNLSRRIKGGKAENLPRRRQLYEKASRLHRSINISELQREEGQFGGGIQLMQEAEAHSAANLGNSNVLRNKNYSEVQLRTATKSTIAAIAKKMQS